MKLTKVDLEIRRSQNTRGYWEALPKLACEHERDYLDTIDALESELSAASLETAGAYRAAADQTINTKLKQRILALTTEAAKDALNELTDHNHRETVSGIIEAVKGYPKTSSPIELMIVIDKLRQDAYSTGREFGHLEAKCAQVEVDKLLADQKEALQDQEGWMTPEEVEKLLADARREGQKPLLGALKELAGNATAGEYESEYDGRTYTFCLGCDYQDDCRPQHRDDCTYVVAHRLLVLICAATDAPEKPAGGR